jgi:hypothetical protein
MLLRVSPRMKYRTLPDSNAASPNRLFGSKF